MSKQMKANKIIRGTFGRVWVNGELMANVKSFESKCNFDYEEVNIAGEMGTYQRYKGYSIEGTMTLHKIDSQMVKLLKDGAMTGDFPDIKIVALVEDPGTYGCERVELRDVTFDELTLLKFETKELSEEEMPFKAGSFNYLDLID